MNKNIKPVEYKPTLTDKIFNGLFVIALVAFSIYVTCKLGYEIFYDVNDSPKPGGKILGYIFLGLGSFISILNFYLSFIRSWLYKKRNGNMDSFRFVSGFPLLGSILLFLASIWLSHSFVINSSIFFFYIIDTGGVLMASLMILNEIYKEKFSI